MALGRSLPGQRAPIQPEALRAEERDDRLDPGGSGRLLVVGPFNGGVGGLERLTRCLADWVEGSSWTATGFFEHRFPDGPYTVPARGRFQAFPAARWDRRVEKASWDLVYVMPAGLRARRWLPRLRRLHAPRIVLDLDPKRKFLAVTDLYHCEAPRPDPLPRPHLVATPDPHPTLPREGDAAVAWPAAIGADPFYLTVFTPYGTIKGADRVPAFCASSPYPLVWCYDPVSFALRSRRGARRVEHHLREGRHPRAILVRAPSESLRAALYRRCAGYVCFSRAESLGFSLLDALAFGSPLCAERVGVCHALETFVPTTDFSRPVFNRCALPPLGGFGSLFGRAQALLTP